MGAPTYANLENHVNYNKVAAADRALERLGLDEDAKNFVIAAADPFHDLPVKFNGLPDTAFQKHVSETLHKQLAISKPTTADSTWCFVVFTTPLDRPVWTYPATDFFGASTNYFVQHSAGFLNIPGLSFVSAAVTNSFDQPEANSGRVPLGSCNIWIWDVDTGRDKFPGGPNQFDPAKRFVPPDQIFVFGTLDDSIYDSTINSSTSNVAYRVVSTAYEITNTSSELNQQGSIVGLRSTSNITRTNNILLNDAAIFNQYRGAVNNWWGDSTPVSCFTFPAPPHNTTEAVAMGARTHHASLGCYATETYDYDDCIYQRDGPIHVKMTCGEPKFASITAGGLEIGNSTCFGNLTMTSTTVVPDIVTAGMSGVFSHVSPRGNTVTYVSGQSQASTFVLDYRVYVQIAPTMADDEYKALVPVLREPIRANSRAIDAAQHLQRAWPHLVPVEDNASGDLWSKLVGFFTSDRAINAGTALVSAIAPEASGVMEMLGNGVKALASKAARQRGKVAKDTINRWRKSDNLITLDRVAGQVGGIKSALERNRLIKQKQRRTRPKPKAFGASRR